MSAAPEEYVWPYDDVPSVVDATGAPVVQKTEAELAIERERNRRLAVETVDLEMNPASPDRLGSVSLADYVIQATEEITVQREHGDVGFKTGVSTFDEKASGLFRPGRVLTLAASTKVAKTTILFQWAAAFAAQDIPVHVFSFEDEGTDSAKRVIANVGSGDIGAIRAGFVDGDGNKMDVPEEFDLATKLAVELGRNVRITTKAGTCAQIACEARAWAGTWSNEKPAGVLLIDQLGHIIDDDPRTIKRLFPGHQLPPHPSDHVKLLKWRMKLLRTVARKLNLLVVVAHQRNANQKDWEEPNESSLLDSKAIGMETDALIMPWRPERLPNPNPGPGQPETVPNVDERMWLVVPIARQTGGRFKVEVEWQPLHQRVADLGTPRGAAWSPPKALNAKQMKGMMATSTLKANWAKRLESVEDEANGVTGALVEPMTPLKAIGTLGAKWALPAPVRATRP